MRRSMGYTRAVFQTSLGVPFAMSLGIRRSGPREAVRHPGGGRESAELKAQGKDVIGWPPASPTSTRPTTSRSRHQGDPRRQDQVHQRRRHPGAEGSHLRQVRARERPHLQAQPGERLAGRQAGDLERHDRHPEPGDEVVVPTPYWVSYWDIVLLAGGTPVAAPTTADTASSCSRPTWSAQITPKTRWVLLNSPSNPSGAAYTAPSCGRSPTCCCATRTSGS
jgi:hypothetical protein